MKIERWVLVGLFVLAVIILLRVDAVANREQGALAAQIRTLAETNRQLAARADSIDRTLRAETVTVTRTLTRREIVRDSILRVDTIPLTRRETVLVAIADTVIRACTDALGTCTALVRIKDAQLANRDSVIRLERARRPSFWDKARDVVVHASIGYAACELRR